MTQEEARRWSDAFTVLSLERLAALFGDLGLPPAIAAEPEGAIQCARSFLEAGVSFTDSGQVNAGVELALSCIADEYDNETAIALRQWCIRFVVDDTYASWLFAWEQLFRRLCHLVSNDGLTVRSPLDSPASERFCSCVAPHLEHPGTQKRRTSSQLEAGTEEPESSWERRLNERMRDAAGDSGQSLRATEMAQTLVSLILRKRRARDAARCLDSALSAEDRERVLAWARSQGELLGIPPSLIESETSLRENDT